MYQAPLQLATAFSLRRLKNTEKLSTKAPKSHWTTVIKGIPLLRTFENILTAVEVKFKIIKTTEALNLYHLPFYTFLTHSQRFLVSERSSMSQLTSTGAWNSVQTLPAIFMTALYMSPLQPLTDLPYYFCLFFFPSQSSDPLRHRLNYFSFYSQFHKDSRTLVTSDTHPKSVPKMNDVFENSR